MFNYLVETKNEYTNHLCNIISPFIYEGFKKMYNDIAFPKGVPVNTELDKDEVLCFFQKCLKQCKNWNTILVGHQTIIENEKNRILTETSKQGYTFLEDLIKASLKANLLILMYNPSCTDQVQIDSSYYENKLNTFFYILYIEFSKELWCNPYLMYHNYSPIDIKRNQRECIALIKECIKETIKKILPMKQILCNYLREDILTKQDPPDNINEYTTHKLKDKTNIVDNIKNILQNQYSTNSERNDSGTSEEINNVKLERNISVNLKENDNIKSDMDIILSALSDDTDDTDDTEEYDNNKDNNNKDDNNKNDNKDDNNKNDNKDDNNKNDNNKDDNKDDNNKNDNDDIHLSLIIPEPCDNSNDKKIKNMLSAFDKVSIESETSIASKYNYKEIFGN